MPCLHRRKRAARDMSSCANGCNASLDFPPSPGLRVWGNAFSSANSNPKHVRGLFLQAPVAGMTNLVDKGCLDDRSAAPWCVVLQVPGRSSLWIAGGSCMRLRTTLQTPANNRIVTQARGSDNNKDPEQHNITTGDSLDQSCNLAPFPFSHVILAYLRSRCEEVGKTIRLHRHRQRHRHRAMRNSIGNRSIQALDRLHL